MHRSCRPRRRHRFRHCRSGAPCRACSLPRRAKKLGVSFHNSPLTRISSAGAPSRLPADCKIGEVRARQLEGLKRLRPVAMAECFERLSLAVARRSDIAEEDRAGEWRCRSRREVDEEVVVEFARASRQRALSRPLSLRRSARRRATGCGGPSRVADRLAPRLHPQGQAPLRYLSGIVVAAEHDIVRRQPIDRRLAPVGDGTDAVAVAHPWRPRAGGERARCDRPVARPWHRHEGRKYRGLPPAPMSVCRQDSSKRSRSRRCARSSTAHRPCRARRRRSGPVRRRDRSKIAGELAAEIVASRSMRCRRISGGSARLRRRAPRCRYGPAPVEATAGPVASTPLSAVHGDQTAPSQMRYHTPRSSPRTNTAKRPGFCDTGAGAEVRMPPRLIHVPGVPAVTSMTQRPRSAPRTNTSTWPPSSAAWAAVRLSGCRHD